MSEKDSSDSANGKASRFLVAVEEEPDTVDFQCTSIHYTIAQNVFDRLVEMESLRDGSIRIIPSLAESWTVTEAGKCYTFHLHKDIRFSNGSPLTSSDVLYTMTRLLTHPDSCNQDIAACIAGADSLKDGTASTLSGFRIINDQDFCITLERPFEAFLACLSMPGASILDEETTKEAGDRFGTAPEWTIGTGPFILSSWKPGEGLILTANPDCFGNPPLVDGLDLRFMTDSEEIRIMFENRELDILDLDDLGESSEFFLHGDIYQERLHKVQQIGISYIALNQSIKPLNDTRVRKALQLALNRTMLLDAVCGGRGIIENGIYPHGLYGYNPELPEIPYDPEEAGKLLREAGYPDGFDIDIIVKDSSAQWEMNLLRLTSSMWEKIGVHSNIRIVDADTFMQLRTTGSIPCYTATWIADYDDPDNFIYTFWGSRENTVFRSFGYPANKTMKRVRKARTIPDSADRIQEYRDLERIIVQEDASYIPLFSRYRYYVSSERLKGFRVSWNGSVKNNYRYLSLGNI